MIVVFFGKRGTVETVLLEHQKTVTATWYTEVCLPKLITTLKALRPRTPLNTWLLHHDNAPAHRAGRTADFLDKMGIQVLGHPAYSPDLAPCDFSLFLYIKQ